MKWSRGLFCLITVVFLFFIKRTSAMAGSVYGNPNITWTPDHEAFTTDYGETDWCKYPQGYTLYIRGLNQNTPQIGEHYYQVMRTDDIPIAYWQVKTSPGNCIHKNAPTTYHEMFFSKYCCRKQYKSGWYATCADCGEMIAILFYMDQETAFTIKDLPAGREYFYGCPHCGHLEMGTMISHECRLISANKYFVEYRKNARDATGFMDKSTFFYNDAAVYEGHPVMGEKKLQNCNYQRRGYVCTGWNTKPDGSGESYREGQAVLNLSADSCGTIVLYAMWSPVSGTLRIDPAGGSYQGNLQITEITGNYQDVYQLSAAIYEKGGKRISFDARGGSSVENVFTRVQFDRWEGAAALHGQLLGNAYHFSYEIPWTDTIKAIYEEQPVILPSVTKNGYSFGGWYEDLGYSRLAGYEGDSYLPKNNCTLYAKWVDLNLTSVQNWNANDGRGAVDLSWLQKDGNQKTYLVYQSTDGIHFTSIAQSENIPVSFPPVDYPYNGSISLYNVQDSGYYALSAWGAQGGNYADYSGGLGGMVSGRVYLEKGDLLIMHVGGQNGINGGGFGNKYASGGGRTEIVSQKLGTLLIAGGGGGASSYMPGEAGGSNQGLREETGNKEGEYGVSGGGSGATGGKAGSLILHRHTNDCIHSHVGNTEIGGPCYRMVVQDISCDIVVDGPYLDATVNKKCPICLNETSYQTFAWRVRHLNCDEPEDWGQNGYWKCSKCGSIGYRWGSGTQKPLEHTHTYKKVMYELCCDVQYSCPYVENPIVSAVAAYGGSNYIKPAGVFSQVNKAGVRSGNGCIQIEGIRIGYEDTTRKKAVPAPDREAPDPILANTIQFLPSANQTVVISFQRPEDNGSTYYHKVESYHTQSTALMCTSNITKDILISGVKGYHYKINEKERDTVTLEDSFADREEISVWIEPGVKYLHIAAVDRAGNLSEAVHVKLSGQETEVLWKVQTDSLQITSEVGGLDYHGVYDTGNGVYYVRCDGITPFVLNSHSTLLGIARKEYQLNRCYLIAYEQDKSDFQEFRIDIPLRTGEGDHSFFRDGLTHVLSMGVPLHNSSYARVQTKNHNTEVLWEQAVCLDSGYHGHSVKIYPRAGVAYENKLICSAIEMDKTHSITIIGDGEAPEVFGLETLQDKEILDMAQGLKVELSAIDRDSGLAHFAMIVQNQEDFSVTEYTPDADGIIRAELSGDEGTFSGDLKITVTATDHVGNSFEKEFNVSAFGLECKVSKILPPYGNVFKCGESGNLEISAWGYADKIEVIFDPVLSALEEGLNKTYIYTEPKWHVEETLNFMIPLGTPEDREYTITVKAYRQDHRLEEYPSVLVIKVTGSVLDEIRTRLR